MTRKRSELEIYLDVLRTVDSGTNRPTSIMCKCNLAWRPFKGVLTSLVENGLIQTTKKGTRKIYEMTERGKAMLKYFERVENLLTTLRQSKVAI